MKQKKINQFNNEYKNFFLVFCFQKIEIEYANGSITPIGRWLSFGSPEFGPIETRANGPQCTKG